MHTHIAGGTAGEIRMMEKEERTMVFIDLRNVTGVLKHYNAKGKVAFSHMTNLVNEERRLMAAYVFDGETNKKSKELHRTLKYEGFKILKGSYNVASNKQKEVDSLMVCEMVAHAFRDNYDTAIIISGDRDFCPAVKLIQSLGKKVEVAGFSVAMSGALCRECDVYHDLDTEELFFDVAPDYNVVYTGIPTEIGIWAGVDSTYVAGV